MSKQKKNSENISLENNSEEIQVSEDVSEDSVIVEMNAPFVLYVSGVYPKPMYLQKGQVVCLSKNDFHNLQFQKANFKIVE